jgi:hypothetical protein
MEQLTAIAHRQARRLPALLHRLRHTQGRDKLTLVVAHVGPLPSSLHDYYESLTREYQARFVFQPANESIPALLNRAAHGNEVDLLFFFSDWLYPVEGWLDDLVVCAEQPGVAIVGGQIARFIDQSGEGHFVPREQAIGSGCARPARSFSHTAIRTSTPTSSIIRPGPCCGRSRK